jgi:nitronate monooxygenase
VLIAQGTEAGGHMGPISLLALLPEVLRVAGDRPVLAAGGLVDGRDLAAMLCLGAAGVVMGTRFLATPESPARATHKQALLAAGPGATVASGIFDLLWGRDWPGVQARALQNDLTAQWAGHEADLLGHLDATRARLAQAEATGNTREMVCLAGTGVSRITTLLPAAQIVHDTVAEATRILRDWGTRVS